MASYVATGVPHAYNWLFNIFLFLAALFSDLLLIKSCLAAGFMWMVILAATGNPQHGDGWASTSEPRVLLLDMLCWGTLNFIMNSIVVALLLRDERTVHFKTEEEERTWRFFYRRSGMNRLEFEQVVRRGEFVTIKAGESIVGHHEYLQSFFLLVEGVAELEVSHDSKQEPKRRRVFSGTLFDLNIANVFGIRVGLLSTTHFAATAVTDCRLLKWSFEMMDEMATKLAPCIPAFWRNMLLYQVSQSLFLADSDGDVPSESATGAAERDGWALGTCRSLDFDAPLTDAEQGKKSFFQWLWQSMHPFPYPGLRHNGLGTSGIAARTRLQLLKDANNQRETLRLTRVSTTM
ncbi:hypothetical protein EMIHUDRAFT_116048 [Emiliania huxleyi CCMP1516]|uniref:Cyclic nucleotide-binding domain-containing protein n=2 Tax=Emiliania huxleyi TaxID=2903 RepID=A0A0D3JL17_EMIH1|nr:hypothetical protein EMIHUDRAFT_116048 [Emiliania huxleyi CCMP1516]EOD24202.1 hypothetical protein EMIHUDRAFT_116048 [Emiliania huxleyi CCMP1516]|eukprot:XP_005776631.1 hypothetical protein EMIHUDRAFT_116048 [Emiliania huxleyi CCMP1516]